MRFVIVSFSRENTFYESCWKFVVWAFCCGCRRSPFAQMISYGKWWLRHKLLFIFVICFVSIIQWRWKSGKKLTFFYCVQSHDFPLSIEFRLIFLVKKHSEINADSFWRKKKFQKPCNFITVRFMLCLCMASIKVDIFFPFLILIN